MQICVPQLVITKNLFTFQTIEPLVLSTVKSAKPAVTNLTFHSGNKGQHRPYLVEMVHIVLQNKRIVTMKNHHLCRRVSSINQNLPQLKLNQIGLVFPYITWACRALIGRGNWPKFQFLILFFYTFNLNSSGILFAVSNKWIQRSLDFGEDSVVLTVKDFVQEMTISSLEFLVSAWKFLLFQKQTFWDKISITPNQLGTFEMRKEVSASAGYQDMDTGGCELSALEDNELIWEKLQVDLDTNFRPGIATPFSPTAFIDLGMGDGGSFKNLLVLDEEEDKENFRARSPVSESTSAPPRLLKCCRFGRQIENVQEFI